MRKWRGFFQWGRRDVVRILPILSSHLCRSVVFNSISIEFFGRSSKPAHRGFTWAVEIQHLDSTNSFRSQKLMPDSDGICRMIFWETTWSNIRKIYRRQMIDLSLKANISPGRTENNGNKEPDAPSEKSEVFSYCCHCGNKQWKPNYEDMFQTSSFSQRIRELCSRLFDMTVIHTEIARCEYSRGFWCHIRVCSRPVVQTKPC
jgi:hypothetical protein